MHKGYTLNYFINYFQSIPDHRWTEGVYHEEGTVRFDAVGHALRNNNASPDRKLTTTKNARSKALNKFLLNTTEDINDGNTVVKGSTPRGRILNALRTRKRLGRVGFRELLKGVTL